ncbi:MAG: hypothetical protein F9K13_00035 [Candidatus Methylomirabilis oxygeniifera]|uniref:Uncharacterized protein n=1 Tax=Methylomirabilis oxygeniifera TaxID=671143 RepID=D5MIE4_METO1|nr:MAG: hypothetical protein F9K13_00035 [Candidatus Methylomirabilis oxyfera]CBE67294.1 exported protein of unknown function [Candidatus Methylomirabilis oxyfera]
MRKFKSTLIVLLLGLTTAVVVGLLVITLFLPLLLRRFACAPYGIRCTIGQANIRPRPNLTVDLVIDHLILSDPDGRGVALRVKRLAATLDIPGLILTRQVMPTDVQVGSPELFFRQLDDGRWNLQALAQEVQRHLRPAARPSRLQFPRASLTNGTLQIRDHRVTDIRVALEPKSFPMLLEMQAQAAVSGRSVRVSGALQNTLEGQILAQVQEVAQPGIPRPLTAQAALRFRVNPQAHVVTIPDWSFETEGALARGTADVRYVAWPPAYTLTVAEWRADLDILAHQFPLPWLSGLTGIMEGEPTTLQGNWPDPPVGQVAAMFKNGRLKLPAQQFGVIGLTGDLNLQHEGNRLRLQAGLHGKALELLGQRYGNPSLLASFSIDTATGGVTAESLRAAITGMHIDARGTGQRWGRDSLDLMTTELQIEPTLLTRLSQAANKGVSIARLVDPSIHVWWPGVGRPWKAEIMSRSIQLHAVAMNSAATLQHAQIAIQGIGMSGRHLEGALAVGQADLAGRRLRALRARFELGPDYVRVPELHVVAGDGDVQGHASFLRTTPMREIRMALSVRGLRPQFLSASTDKTAQGRGVTVDAELSADATLSGSQPSSAAGRVTIRNLSLNLARAKTQSASPIMRLRGSIPFALNNGLLTIPKTALHEDGGLTLILTGSLPLDHKSPNAARVHLSVPWTEVSALRPMLTALTEGPPDAAHFIGRLQADLEFIGQSYHGSLALQNVSVRSNFFRLEAATGVIPLHGQIGQSSIASDDRASPSEQIGERHLSEQAYQAAVERLSKMPSKIPASLTINSLRYDPIELRNITVALAQSDNQVAIRQFSFDAWGGRWSGWGTVEPLGGGIELTVLTEGLSLRAICDAFRPFQGYISGRINGLLDLRIPQFAINRAHGNARYWTVGSLQEGRKISRALIEQIAGQQIRYFSPFGVARRYDRGVLDVTLQAGDLVFHELEISHTTLGWRDLDVRVSPTFNKIGLTHLIETIRETIERVRGSAASNH